ncbi:MAG TPA: hypothetical protein DEF77_05860 [Gammaproteobacteria bacterium]|nr:hypothetical protein [Gammaproteobacteria bacterium]
MNSSCVICLYWANRIFRYVSLNIIVRPKHNIRKEEALCSDRTRDNIKRLVAVNVVALSANLIRAMHLFNRQLGDEWTLNLGKADF